MPIVCGIAMETQLLALVRGKKGCPMSDPAAAQKEATRMKREKAARKEAARAAARKEAAAREAARLARAAKKAARAAAKKAARKEAAASEAVAAVAAVAVVAVVNTTASYAELLALQEKYGGQKRYKARNPKPQVTEAEIEAEKYTIEQEFDLWQEGIIAYEKLSNEMKYIVDRINDWDNDGIDAPTESYKEYIAFEQRYEYNKDYVGTHNWVVAAELARYGEIEYYILSNCVWLLNRNKSLGTKAVVDLAFVYNIDKLDDAVINVLIQVNRYQNLPNTKARNLRLVAPIWAHCPKLPYRLAIKLATHGCDSLLVYGLQQYSDFLHRFHVDIYDWVLTINDRKKAIATRNDYINVAIEIGAYSHAVSKKYGMNSELTDSVSKWLLHQEDKTLPELKAKAYAGVVAIAKAKGQRIQSGTIELCIRLAAAFGNRYQEWVTKNEKLNRSFHDMTYWLPMSNNGVDSFLLKHVSRPITELEIITKAWESLTPEQKVMSYKELLSFCRSMTYPGAKDSKLAGEAAQWGISQKIYTNLEKRYIVSLATPSFHPEVKVSLKDLTGRFLPRTDVRGLFLGQHTNCCQHPTGQGKACAWYGQEAKNSGFFVVEDKQGEIVAQSWTWETQDGICFDNVEAKGLGTRDADVGAIYKLAAQKLSANTPLVTMGTGLGDLACIAEIGVDNGRSLSLPHGYSGYSDARSSQYVIAEGDPITTRLAADTTYVRGLLEDDLPAIEAIATVIYPQGWQYAGTDTTDYGLVLIHEGQIVGYSCMETDNYYVADIAVLPEARGYSRTLVDATLSYCRRVGDKWSADCRESTSYRLLKLYERRGRVVIHSATPSGYMGEEPMINVVFTP